MGAPRAVARRDRVMKDFILVLSTNDTDVGVGVGVTSVWSAAQRVTENGQVREG